ADTQGIQDVASKAREKYVVTGEDEKIFDRSLNQVKMEGKMDSAARELGYENADEALDAVGAKVFDDFLGKNPDLGSQTSYTDLDGLYTSLGRTLATRELPGGVAKGLGEVRDAVGAEMGNVAASAGPEILDLHNQARVFWRGYENTFHDMRA